MLQHFGITRKNVFGVECTEKLGVNNDGLRLVEDTDFVFQTVEVDACLSAHTGIDHGEQGSGNVHILDATFEGAGSKATQISDHTAAEVNQEGVACAAAIA